MDKEAKLSTKDQEILEKMAEMVNFIKGEFTKRPIYKHKLTPKQTLVVTMFAAVNSYTEAIFELCKQSRPEAAIVILRSLIEAWINSNYVLGHPNENLLWVFAIEDSYYRGSLVDQIKDLYKRYPKLRSKWHPRKKLKEMRSITENELNAYKSKLGISFKNKEEFDKAWGRLKSRAQHIDRRLNKKSKGKAGGIEHTYILVYKYFSEYVHLQMRGLQHFWVRGKMGDTLILDKNPSHLTHVLVTTYIMYLYFASRLKQYKLIDSSLSRFGTYFKNELTKAISTAI